MTRLPHGAERFCSAALKRCCLVWTHHDVMPDPDAEAPLVHDACTIAEQGDGGVLIWVVVCFCGWCSAEHEDEFGADFARLDHPDADEPASTGGGFSQGRRADAAQLLLAGIAADRATITAGLSEDELAGWEGRLGFRFAPDHRHLLSRVLPVGEGWPDWRADSEEILLDRMEGPLRQLEAAVGAGAFWWDSWGPRPSDDVDAVLVAHEQLLNVPRIVPLFENRYLPAVPAAAGNPVFSWYFADVIVYASNLTDYLRQEFAHARGSTSPGPVREVPFWSALVRYDTGGARRAIIENRPVEQEQDAEPIPSTGAGGVLCDRCGCSVEMSLAEQRARPDRYLPQACARCHGKGDSQFWRATFDVLERLGRHDAVNSRPPTFTVGLLTDVDDVLARAHQLAREAHADHVDKAGRGYYEGHLLDVLQRAVAYGADLDGQAAAVLHAIVEDTDVTGQDLLACGFSDETILIVHLMTRREDEPDEVYYARLRAYEPARRLKLDADVASNSDPERLALLEPGVRQRLTEKYAKAKAMLTPISS